MQPKFDQIPAGLSATMVAAGQRILAGLPMTMSGNIRAQHMGVYFTILMLNEANEQVDNHVIAKLCNMHKTHVSRIAASLASLGVIERQQITASHGKGKKYLYKPVTQLSKILSLLDQARKLPESE